jgi:hypothetical protein
MKSVPPEIWTDDQVRALNEHQTAGERHPFTCGNDRGDGRHRRAAADRREVMDAVEPATDAEIEDVHLWEWCQSRLIGPNNTGFAIDPSDLPMRMAARIRADAARIRAMEEAAHIGARDVHAAANLEHDQRRRDLQEANNREVERRRQAEARERQMRKALIAAAATLGAIDEWRKSVEAAGGAKSIEGIAMCHAMLTSLRKNADRTETLVMIPARAALAAPAP